MAAPPQVDTIFLGFNHALEQDANTREDIRKHVKELELHVRKITTLLQQIHSQKQSECMLRLVSSSLSTLVAETCAKGRAALPAVVTVLNQLQSMIPRQDYYKYWALI